MDPANAIGLAVTTLDILAKAYKVGKDAKNAKEEIRALAHELSALKASLEYIKFVDDAGNMEDEESLLKTSNLDSPESQEMLISTEKLLTDLLEKLKPKTGGLQKTWQRLTWHFEKSDMKEYLERLEAAKSWFILAASTDNTALCRASYIKIRSIEQSLQVQTTRYAKQDVKELQDRVKSWLCPHDTQPLYQQARENFRSGTGIWFLEADFRTWIHGDKTPGLWLRAKPGFGKTTLMAGAISAAKALPDKTVAYWFCSFTEPESQDLQNLIGSIIYQLTCSTPALFEEIDKKYPSLKDHSVSAHNERPSLAQLREILTYTLARLGPTFLFIDAVNEHKEPERLVEILDDILQDCKNCRVLITGIEAMILDIPDLSFTILHAYSDTNKLDIEFCVDALIQENKRLRRLPTALKDNIRETLCRDARGSFRWVQCQMDTLSSQTTLGDINKALESLPSTLEQTYQRALDRIPEKDRSRARNTLLWLCYAYRRMRLEEIAEAAVLPQDKPYDQDTMRLLYPDEILDLCSSLVSYDEYRKTVTIAHSSVLEFLVRVRSVDSRKEFRVSWDNEQDPMVRMHPDTFIAERSLSYLLLPEFESGYVKKEKLWRRFERWPLLTYMADVLWRHLVNVDPQGEIKPLLTRFLNSQRLHGGGNFGSWVQAHNPKMTDELIEETTPLYWACREGYVPLIKIILSLDGTRDLERPGGKFGSTPLHAAAWSGQVEVVKVLLEAGANVHETNNVGENGLFWALMGGTKKHEEVVELLIKAGAGRKQGIRKNLYERLNKKTPPFTDSKQDEETKEPTALHGETVVVLPS